MSTVDPFKAALDLEIDEWRHGKCYAMAIALHELTGKPIAVLYSMRTERDPRWHPVHMAIVTGNDEIMDAGGKFSRHEIFDEYLPEGVEHRKYARSVGHWEDFENVVALKDRLIAEEGRDFIESYGWPYITKLVPTAKEFAERHLDLENSFSTLEFAS